MNNTLEMKAVSHTQVVRSSGTILQCMVDHEAVRFRQGLTRRMAVQDVALIHLRHVLIAILILKRTVLEKVAL